MYDYDFRRVASHPHAEALASAHRVYTEIARLQEEFVRLKAEASTKVGKNAHEFLQAMLASEIPEPIKHEAKPRLEHALANPSEIPKAMGWVFDRAAKFFKKDMVKGQALFAAGEGLKMANAFHAHRVLEQHWQEAQSKLGKVLSKKEQEAENALDELMFDEPSSPAEEECNRLVHQLTSQTMTAQEALHLVEKIKTVLTKVEVDPNQLTLFARRR